MDATLGDLLAEARRQRRWTLREVERRTGIRNAHLSQIETGAITRPDTALLWTLADLYDLDFGELMRLAGRTETGEGNRLAVAGVALKALGELTPAEQDQALRFMQELRKRKRGRATDAPV